MNLVESQTVSRLPFYSFCQQSLYALFQVGSMMGVAMISSCPISCTFAVDEGMCYDDGVLFSQTVSNGPFSFLLNFVIV